jgi:ATP/maltotriose-dependent transcriptional regulator MalT
MTSDPVSPARAPNGQRDWRAVHAGLREREDLSTSDLGLLAEAAWWLGRSPESMEVSEEIYRRLLAEGETHQAADRALRLALEWLTRGEVSVGMAWLARARRVISGLPHGVLHGYLLYCDHVATMDLSGDVDTDAVDAAAEEIATLATEHDEPTLSSFALAVRGMAAVRQGHTREGFDLLDEAMLPVLAGRVDPLWAGDLCCTVIHLCDELGDLARMRAWTESMARWSRPQGGTFMYAHVTRVHEQQLLVAEGAWDTVEDELGARSDDLVGAHGWLAGEGYYTLGEVRRLRGDAAGAEEAYALARELNHDALPGSALLLLRAQGRTSEALAALRVGLADATRLGRARMVPAAVELALAEGETSYARTLVAELEETAEWFATPGLLARAAQARAALDVAEGRQQAAVVLLERAAAVYREQRYRYAIATVHEALAAAHRAAGEPDRADAAAATALAIYRQLGAAPDVARLTARDRPCGLTKREVEVLAAVAAGATNREVASALVISEKTVGRHLANIFTKIGVGTRTAAAAWAREHGLV